MSHEEVKYDVFLSYNNRDHAEVEVVARRLKELGLTVFLDRWYLVAGTPWPQHLETILNACRAAAIFLGPYGMGRWQQREQYLALDRQAKNSDFPVIPVLLPGADPALGFLSLNTWVDLRQGLDSPGSLTLLAGAIQGKPPGPDFQRRIATALSTICPYRGLRFFREEDAPFFFGRDAFIERLAGAVNRHTLVAVVGASGSGKSSVVRAGLVPRLRQRRGDQVWDIATIVPGDRPLQSLAAVMVRLLEPDMTEVDRLKEIGKLAELFGAGQLRLRDVISRAIEKQPGTDRLMLVVDQWEELYTLTRDQSSRQRFLDEILDATTLSPLSVVLTLRGDFFDQVLSHRPFSDRIQDATVNVSRMTREELTQVIESPARKVGLRFESGLVNRILDKVQGQPGNLPLLEFVLTELWKERQEELLSHAAYEKIGEIQGAIATHAETVFAALSPSDQEITRRVFLQLVRPAAGGDTASHETEMGPTRRRTSFAELGSESLPVVRKLADAHLIVTGRNEATGEEIVDLVHEALIEAWSRLRGWVADDRVFLVWRERLRTLFSISAASGYEKNTLLRGHLLTEAKGWLQKRRPDLSTSEQGYIEASIKAGRSRLTWQAAISLGVLVVLAVSGIFLYRSRFIVIPGGDGPTPTPSASIEGPVKHEDEPQKTEITEDALRTRLSEIRLLLGVTSLEMNSSPTIAVLGPAPTAGTLPEEQMRVLDPPAGANLEEFSGMSNYVSSLVQCVKYVAPNVKFVFIPVRFDSNLGADLSTAINQLIASGDKPNILLAPYRFPSLNDAGSALRVASSQGVLVVTSTGLQESLPPNSENMPFRKQFMMVASVNLEGHRSSFSPQYAGLLWSLGEDIPVKSEGRMIAYSGTGPAAALAAGVAARIVDRHPQLTPAQIIQVMRAASLARTSDGPPVIKLDATLTRLSTSR
ncbi:MAG TPA: toll/interleukin-1 receptor domain-containing protein [Pyrinomonadaceae bacterium]|nr:toll/interleukin-1 receptor domain-containing protein [Pyrinomonadaceae bacterium]